MNRDGNIAAHYERGSLLDAIRAGLDAAGIAPDHATHGDLAPVDEFHIGGREATRRLCEQLDLAHTDTVLDIGSGLGGTARYIASTYGCSVTGVDLTPEYVDVARSLSAWTGLADRTEFTVASALDTGSPADRYDVATQVHVGMNIEDKSALFSEVYRVLRPGGRYAIYDIMRTAEGSIGFPVPWATDATMSFVEPATTYAEALTRVGFDVIATADRGDAARAFFAGIATRSDSGPPPLGLHLVMGPDTPTKFANMIAAVTAGTLAPTEIIARKPA